MLIAALLAALLHPYDPYPVPALELIDTGRDTVWFSAPATDWSPATSYGYVRATRRWLRVAGVVRARAAAPLPQAGDSVAIAPGYTLARLVPDAEGRPGGLVLVARDGRRFPVAADPAAARAAIRAGLGDEWTKAHGDSLPPISSAVTAWARDDGGIWFGFDGGEYEAAEGDFGVLLRFDLARQRFDVVATPELASAHVSALAVAGGRLWVGTQYPQQLEGMVGEHGLLVRDLARGTWSTLGTRERALPGDLVYGVAADDGALWVTTDGGVSRLDVREGGWTTQYFTLGMRGDSVVHELAPAPADQPRAAITILTLAELLGAPRRAFWDAASALPPSRFELFISLDDEEWDVTGAAQALAHPAMVPFLRDAVRRGGSGRDVAVEALSLIGSPDVLPLLRAAFDSSRGSQRIASAIALGRLGDSVGLRYLRARLADTVSAGEDDTSIDAVIQGIAVLNDREGMSMLRPWLRTKTGAPAAFAVLADRADLAGWRTLAREARAERMLWQPVLVRVAHCDSGCRDPVNDPDVRSTVSDIARRAMVDRGYGEQWAPAAIAVRYGDVDAMPYLIGALTIDRMHYDAAVRALIRLTGIDSVPAPREASPPERLRAQRFFAAWWAAHGRDFRPVPRQVGEAALLRWYDRDRASP